MHIHDDDWGLAEMSDPCVKKKKKKEIESESKRQYFFKNPTPCPFLRIVNGCRGICCGFYSGGV